MGRASMRDSCLVGYKPGAPGRTTAAAASKNDRDRGATAVEFAGLTVLASLIVLAIMATPVAKTMTSYTGDMVDKILNTKDEISSGPSTLADFSTAGAPTKKAAAAVTYAMSQLGKPYVWGAEGPDAFDCSGLMYWAYGKAGVSMMRTSQTQFTSQPHVNSKSQLKPGDLVYFNTLPGPGPTHVGMYIGNGKFVQAPNKNDVVKVSSLNEPYYVQTYAGATRPTSS